MKRKAVARVPIPSPKRILRSDQTSDGENEHQDGDKSDNLSTNGHVVSHATDISKDSPCTPKSNGPFKQFSAFRDNFSPAISTSPYLGVELNLSTIKGTQFCDASSPDTLTIPVAGEVKVKNKTNYGPAPNVNKAKMITDSEKSTETDSQKTTETENSGVSLNDTYLTLSTANSSVTGEPSQSSDPRSRNTCSESEYSYLTDSSVDSISGSASSRDGFPDQEMEMRQHALQYHNRIASLSARSLMHSETDSSLDYEDSLRLEDTSTGKPDGHVTVLKTSLYGTDDDTIGQSDNSGSSNLQTPKPTNQGRVNSDFPESESLSTSNSSSPSTRDPRPRESMTLLEQACLADSEKRNSETDVADADNDDMPRKKTVSNAVDELIEDTVEHERNDDISRGSDASTEVLTNGDCDGAEITNTPDERSKDISHGSDTTEMVTNRDYDGANTPSNTADQRIVDASNGSDDADVLPTINYSATKISSHTISERRGDIPRGNDTTEVLTNGDYSGAKVSSVTSEERSEFVRQFRRYESARDGVEDAAAEYSPDFPAQKGNVPVEIRPDGELYPDANGLYAEGKGLRQYPRQLSEVDYRGLGPQDPTATYNDMAGNMAANMSPNIDSEAMRLALASELMQTYGGKTPDKTLETGPQFEYGAYGSRHLDEIHGHYSAEYRYAQPTDVLDTPQQRPVSDLGFDPQSSSTPDHEHRKGYSPGSSQGSYTYNDIHLHGGNWSSGLGYNHTGPTDPRLRPHDKHSIYHSPGLETARLALEIPSYREPRPHDPAYYPGAPSLGPGTGKMAAAAATTPPHFYKPLPDNHEPSYYAQPQPLEVTRMTCSTGSLMISHVNGSHLQNVPPNPYGRPDANLPAPHLAEQYIERQPLSDIDYSSIYPSRDFIERNSGTTLSQIRQPKRYPPKVKRAGKVKTMPKVERSECSTPEDTDKKPFDSQHRYYVVNPSDATNMVPKTLLSKYIDFLILENEQMTEISKSVTAPVDIYVTEDMYFMDTLKIRRCFPSKKFEEWSSSFYPKLNLKTMKFADQPGGKKGDGERDARPTQQVLEDVFYFFQREAITCDRRC